MKILSNNYPMNVTQELSEETSQVLQLSGVERWEVYHRLQDLEIPCQCNSNKPLQIQVRYPLDIIQVWSIVRCTQSSRQELSTWLEHCWNCIK